MAAELRIGIGADNSELRQGLQDAEAQISSFVNKVGKIGQIGEQLSSIGQKMSVGLTLPIVALGGAAIKAYGDIQSLQKGLEAVMGSGASAAKEFERLKEVAKLPGLGMEEAVRGSINLQAIGIDAENSRKILSQFGNAVASVGKGKAEFERAIYGVQQLANTDFPLGEDLNIIKDALPQVSNLLKDAFGTSRSDELAKMGVSSKQVLDTITAGLEKLPRVTGGINGAFENLGDSMKTSLERIGKIIDDTFDISGIIDKLTGYLDTAISYFEELSPTIQKTVLVVTGLVAAVGPLLVAVGGFISMMPTILAGIGGISTALTVLTGPIGLVVVGIGAIIAAVVTNWGKIKPYIIDTINYFRDLYNESIIVRGAVAGLTTVFKIAFSAISNTLKTAWEVFKTFAKATADLFGGVGKVLKGALTGDLDSIKAGLGQMAIAWNTGLTDLGKDIAGGIKSFHNDVKKHLSDGLNDVLNGGNLKPISDIKIFDEEKITEKTKKTVKNGVEKGVKKAASELKDIKIELPDLEVVEPKGGFKFMNNLGEQFSSLEDLLARNDKLDQAIKSSLGGIPIALSESEIAIQEAGIKFEEAVNGLISEGMLEGLTNSFTAMGEAMFNGGNIIAAAGGAILSTLGQFLQMLGKEMIKLALTTVVLGNLVSGIKKWIIANPGAAIALAGIALAAGAALSAAGSSIGKGGGGGSVPSGGASSQSYSSSFSGGGAGGGEVVFRISGNDLVGVLSRQQDKNSRLGG